MINDFPLAAWARPFLVGFVPACFIYLAVKAGAADVFLALVIGTVVGVTLTVAMSVLGLGGLPDGDV